MDTIKLFCLIRGAKGCKDEVARLLSSQLRPEPSVSWSNTHDDFTVATKYIFVMTCWSGFFSLSDEVYDFIVAKKYTCNE